MSRRFYPPAENTADKAHKLRDEWKRDGKTSYRILLGYGPAPADRKKRTRTARERSTRRRGILPVNDDKVVKGRHRKRETTESRKSLKNIGIGHREERRGYVKTIETHLSSFRVNRARITDNLGAPATSIDLFRTNRRERRRVFDPSNGTRLPRRGNPPRGFSVSLRFRPRAPNVPKRVSRVVESRVRAVFIDSPDPRLDGNTDLTRNRFTATIETRPRNGTRRTFSARQRALFYLRPRSVHRPRNISDASRNN